MSAKLAEYKCEEALQLLLQAQADIAALIVADAGSETPFDVYTGIDDGAIDYSCITVEASSSEPLGPLIGNWLISVFVKVHTNSKDTAKADHYLRIAYAQAVIMSDSLQDDINGKVAGLVIGEPGMKGRTTSTRDGVWIHETQIAVPCMDGA